MNDKFLKLIPKAIAAGPGGIKAFQERMKIELADDPDILDDPIARYIIGACAEHQWYKHTETWRKYLTKYYGFEFVPGEDIVKCGACGGTGIALITDRYDPKTQRYVDVIPPGQETCSYCDAGAGKVKVNVCRAFYNGQSTTEGVTDHD